MEILLFLYFSSILFGIFKQRSLLSFVYIFVVAWIIMAGNTLNPDYDNYVVRYNSGDIIFYKNYERTRIVEKKALKMSYLFLIIFTHKVLLLHKSFCRNTIIMVRRKIKIK